MKVLVFVDSNEGSATKSSLEAVAYGSKMASDTGGECIAVTNISTDQSKSLGNYGASKVLCFSGILGNDIEKFNLVKAAAESCEAETIVFSLDYTGKAVAPMVAASLNAGYVPGAVEFPSSYEPLVVKKNVFSGKAMAHMKINTATKVIAVLPNSIDIETSNQEAEVESIEVNTDSRVKTVETKLKGSGGINLTEAEIVVSAGRGMKGPENWGDVEELANLLGAATACSRPVADIGWRPHHEHVGQTGIAIRPNLYIAIGISGAIQHLAGVNGSKVIVVINKDPEAPFFKAADYGIVGDAFEVLPKLVEAAKQLKSA